MRFVFILSRIPICSDFIHMIRMEIHYIWRKREKKHRLKLITNHFLTISRWNQSHCFRLYNKIWFKPPIPSTPTYTRTGDSWMNQNWTFQIWKFPLKPSMSFQCIPFQCFVNDNVIIEIIFQMEICIYQSIVLIYLGLLISKLPPAANFKWFIYSVLDVKSIRYTISYENVSEVCHDYFAYQL